MQLCCIVHTVSMIEKLSCLLSCSFFPILLKIFAIFSLFIYIDFFCLICVVYILCVLLFISYVYITKHGFTFIIIFTKTYTCIHIIISSSPSLLAFSFLVLLLFAGLLCLPLLFRCHAYVYFCSYLPIKSDILYQ